LTSVDLSWEDARTVMVNIGFQILEEKLNVFATYTENNKSLMSTSFRCIFFVAKKNSLQNETGQENN
jgi:carnosine N-methyltransferase